jgi:DNA-binding CsgD family transcriptional regulator
MSATIAKGNSKFTTRIKLEEHYRLFFQQSQSGCWLAQLDKPLPTNFPIEQQAIHMLKHAYLAECNLSFVKMYDYDDHKLLIGARFPQLFDHGESSNLISLHSFLKNGYQTRNSETLEIGKNGNRKYFLNDAIGIVEDHHLVRVWGMQKDITLEKSQQKILRRMTPEQMKVLKSTVEGKTMKEIASEIGGTIKSVESVRNHLKALLSVDTVVQLVAAAIRLGIQDID